MSTVQEILNEELARIVLGNTNALREDELHESARVKYYIPSQ